MAVKLIFAKIKNRLGFWSTLGVSRMDMRSKTFSSMIALAMAGVMCGITAQTANAASALEAQDRGAGADEICAVLGIGSGAAGLSKALAKGASWVGIGASAGCYLYSQAKDVTPAEQQAAMQKSYNDYQAKSDLGKLEALGYYCRKADDGGGGGTDSAPEQKIGARKIRMKGVEYTCQAIRD